MSVSSGWSVQNKWNILFGIWALHGMIALWQFLSQPSGVSFKQALIGGSLLFWIVLNLFLIVSISRNSQWLFKLLDLLRKPAVKDGVFAVATLSVFLRMCLGIVQAVAVRTVDFRYIGFADLLSPVLNLMTLILIEVIALILFFSFREKAEYKTSIKSFSVKLLAILTLLGLTALYVSLTDMGIAVIYKGDWARGLPAVPLLEWQIILACVFCVGMVIAESNDKMLKIPRLDLWIALAVWLGTAALWLGQPIVPNSSALEPRAPNFEVYPFNDAQTYDEFSQSVLIGNGFGENEIPQRPLYVVFLTVLHVLVGQGYGNMIVLQSIVFALFPVLLYLFGREFFGRPIGISIALLAMLRDYTSNLVSPFTGNLSYSKLYLSEIPTAMFLILFLLIGMRWIKSGFPAFTGLLMGGVLGVAMLIRTQVVVAFPVIILFAFLSAPKKFSHLFKSVSLMLITLLLVITPWLWRNWHLTGSFIFDNPESQTINLALRYSRLNGVEPEALPFAGESNRVYNERLKQMTHDAILANPLGAVRGIFSSFLNHGVNNLLLFPLQNDLRNPAELLTPADAFWEEWEGDPTPSQLALISFYIFLLSLGIATAWHRNGWLGLLPLGVNLVYNLWTSLALLSGQRFMLTMDWSIYLYYMIGLFSLLSIFLFALQSGRSMILKWYETNVFSFAQQVEQKKWWQYIFVGVLFLGIGASLPSSEMVFSKKYPPVTQDVMLNKLVSSLAFEQTNLDTACFQKIIVGNQLKIIQGRAVYPRYYGVGRGETFTDSFGYKTTDEGRLVFQMIGEANGRFVFPMSEPPDFFPNASDVTLLLDKNRIPRLVYVKQGDNERLYISESFDFSICQ